MHANEFEMIDRIEANLRAADDWADWQEFCEQEFEAEADDYVEWCASLEDLE